MSGSGPYFIALLSGDCHYNKARRSGSVPSNVACRPGSDSFNKPDFGPFNLRLSVWKWSL